MIHERERLSFLLESSQHPVRIVSRTYDLERHAALHRFELIGGPNFPHSSFAELLAQLEAARKDAIGSKRACGRRLGRQLFDPLKYSLLTTGRSEQPLDPVAHRHVAGARVVQ